MKRRIVWVMSLLISGYLISGCSPRAQYERRLKHELARGLRYDSLFLGLYFGMQEKEFYVHCWQLNHKGILRQGSSNTTAEYKLKDELRYPAQMDFYPKFSDGKIFEIPVSFSYEGWSPWNKKLSSENLQKEILRWYEKVYGKGFIRVEHRLNGTAYVKVDGNRRITIFKQDDLHVWVVFTDMLVKKNWNVPSAKSEYNQGKILKDSTK